MAQLTGTLTVQCADRAEYDNWAEQLVEAKVHSSITGVLNYLEHLDDLQIEVELSKDFVLPEVGVNDGSN